jgi:hypothetical protein
MVSLDLVRPERAGALPWLATLVLGRDSERDDESAQFYDAIMALFARPRGGVSAPRLIPSQG